MVAVLSNSFDSIGDDQLELCFMLYFLTRTLQDYDKEGQVTPTLTSGAAASVSISWGVFWTTVPAFIFLREALEASKL